MWLLDEKYPIHCPISRASTVSDIRARPVMNTIDVDKPCKKRPATMVAMFVPKVSRNVPIRRIANPIRKGRRRVELWSENQPKTRLPMNSPIPRAVKRIEVQNFTVKSLDLSGHVWSRLTFCDPHAADLSSPRCPIFPSKGRELQEQSMTRQYRKRPTNPPLMAKDLRSRRQYHPAVDHFSRPESVFRDSKPMAVVQFLRAKETYGICIL